MQAARSKQVRKLCLFLLPHVAHGQKRQLLEPCEKFVPPNLPTKVKQKQRPDAVAAVLANEQSHHDLLKTTRKLDKLSAGKNEQNGRDDPGCHFQNFTYRVFRISSDFQSAFLGAFDKQPFFIVNNREFCFCEIFNRVKMPVRFSTGRHVFGHLLFFRNYHIFVAKHAKKKSIQKKSVTALSRWTCFRTMLICFARTFQSVVNVWDHVVK